MIWLASTALAVALALGALAVSRLDAPARRRVAPVALVAVAVVVAGGGVAAQATAFGAGDVGGADDAVGVASTGATTNPGLASVPTATATPDAASDAAERVASTAASRRAMASGTDPETATVVAVQSGDRLTYRDAAGRRHTVRLAGVDAPGIDGADPHRFDGVLTGERGRACLADGGRRALVSLRERLVGESVTVRRIADGRAGLPAVVVETDNRSVNRALVESGRARATGDRYADAERAARDAHLGVWACGLVEPPRPLHQSSEQSVRIAAVHPNPPGDDGSALTREYVVLANDGRQNVDLSGWYLRVGDDQLYFFDDQVLEPGAELVVHVGSGTDAPDDVYWGSSHAVLGNDHDAVTVVDADGDDVDAVAY
ncbi:MAG: lamin tail domain-containing protein [Haloplanus sp.]